jgi:hypothetical protein
MAKINHDRPHFKYYDNLKRVQTIADSWFEASEGIEAPSDTPKTSDKEPSGFSIGSPGAVEAIEAFLANKKASKRITERKPPQFSKSEKDICLQLLRATEEYYENFSKFLENFSNKKKKINIKGYEEALRVSIRNFIFGFMKELISKGKDGPLSKFFSLLTNELPEDALLIEIIGDEIEAGAAEKALEEV